MSIFSLKINMYIYIIKYSINHGLMTIGQSPPFDLVKENKTKTFTQYFTEIGKCIVNYKIKYKPKSMQ